MNEATFIGEVIFILLRGSHFKLMLAFLVLFISDKCFAMGCYTRTYTELIPQEMPLMGLKWMKAHVGPT